MTLKIVIPMAGNGSRFANAGYKDPKPFIPINDKRMIECVVENLRPSIPHQFIFIARKEHLDNYNGRDILSVAAPGCEIVELDQVTEGAACTVLLASPVINNSDPLLIANSDQLVECSIDSFLNECQNHDGCIMTMNRSESKWSFVGRNRFGHVNRVVEKQPISLEATVGIYYYSEGREFVSAALEMIAKNLRYNNEFYVAPVYNQLIEAGGRVGTYQIPGKCFTGLGTPEELEVYLNSIK